MVTVVVIKNSDYYDKAIQYSVGMSVVVMNKCIYKYKYNVYAERF